jgi:hypothetical protein
VPVNQRAHRQLQQHAYRHVDREMKVEPRLVEHGPAVDRGNERVLGQARHAAFGHPGQEASRQQHAEAWVADARQRLGTRKALAPEIDLWLVPHLEPAILERLVDLDAWPRAGTHGVQERTPLGLAQLVNCSRPILRSGILSAHQPLAFKSMSL